MPKSLRYLKKIYHCHVTINVKAFPPFQPRINATKTEQLDNLQALPSAKLRHQLVPFFGWVWIAYRNLGGQEDELPLWQAKCKKRFLT